MSKKGWWLTNVVLAVVGGVCGVLGIYTGVKAAEFEQDQQFENLEKRYGLTPIETEEEA